MRKIDSALHDRLTKLITSMGYEFVGGELSQDRGQSIFRIYIDGPNGVSSDDCSKVSHQVSAMFDVEDPIQGRYFLEVSSPGIDRPLFDLEHYRKYVGSRIKVKLYSPIDERKQYKGILKRVEQEDICLLADATGLEIVLPFSAIEKANVIADIDFKRFS